MSNQKNALIDSAVKSQHQTIMEGGKIEEFAEALGRFCRIEGWKKLKDENGLPFKSLRHYIEASPPFGAGYPGKEGMDKIEAYLALKPEIKDYFQHCHANCIFEMAEEEGISPSVLSKREWDDTKGARLAKIIQENPETAYKEKAMAYIEGKERVKQERKPDPMAPVRISCSPRQPYRLAHKIKSVLSEEELELFKSSLLSENLEELVEFERRYNLALMVFNKTKQKEGWGIGAIKAPENIMNRMPTLKKSCYIETKKEGKDLISLRDERGEIATVRVTSKGAKAISFEKK